MVGTVRTAFTLQAKNPQEHLLLIHELSQEHHNSGSLTKALNKFYNRIKGIKKTNQSIPVLSSILVDIAYKNPRTYPITAAILSKLLSLLRSKAEREQILNSITKRFEKIPNTGHLQIWLQRITIKNGKKDSFSEKLCEKVIDPETSIWNSDWLNADFKKLIDKEPIVSPKVIKGLDKVIEPQEVQLFEAKTSYTY